MRFNYRGKSIAGLVLLFADAWRFEEPLCWIFMLVSCATSSGLEDQIWVWVVSDSRPDGLESKFWTVCLEMLWRAEM